jgi:hypothetical protein
MTSDRSLFVRFGKSVAALIVQAGHGTAQIVKSGFLTRPLVFRDLNHIFIGADVGPRPDFVQVCQLKITYIAQSLFGSHAFAKTTHRVYKQILATRQLSPGTAPVEMI